MTHEIQLIDESAICESSSFGKGILVFDATSPNPVDTLHITSNDLWNGLTITVAFEFKEFYEQVPMDHNGIVPVPNWVFNHSATSVCPGQIIFTGVAPNLRRIITSLPYVVNGVFIKPPQLYARWPIFSGASRSEFPDIGYSNVIYKAEDERALYQWDVNTSTYEQLVFLPSFADTNTTYKLELDPVDVHKIILYARDIGEEDWCNVGEIETADTVYDDQELRSAVENVSMLVGKTPVAEQISSAIRALSVPDEAVAGQFITTVAQSDGKVAVSRRALQESDVPALGMGKVNGLQDALDLKATTASVTAVDKKVTQLSGTVGTVQGSVTTLVGNDANKSVRTIANEELAAQLIPEGATEALDTLQEIAAWIQHHPNDAAALNSSIAALQAQLNGIETGNGTVKSYVDTAVQDLAQQVNQDIQEIELTPGPQGPPGADGQTGATGPTGADGQDGVSPTVTTETISGGTRVTITDASGAHEFDVMNGQNGAPGADGQDGQNGQDGITPTIGENGNWFLGDTDTGKPSRGEIGLTGPVGPEGPPGAQGEPGKDGVQIDDTAVSSTEAWSSRKIVDTLCAPFSAEGNPVVCAPVEGYPLGVTVSLEPVQAGKGDPSPENIRPISGREAVSVTRCGKNLLDVGEVNISHFIKIALDRGIPPGTYTFSGSASTDADSESLLISCLDAEGKLVASVYLPVGSMQSYTVALSRRVETLQIYAAKNNADAIGKTAKISELQLEFGSAATQYEPYSGQDFTLVLPEMIYGGSVDAVTGEGSKEWALVEFDGTEDWTLNVTNIVLYNAVSNPANTNPGIGHCSHFAFRYNFAGDNVFISGAAIYLGKEMSAKYTVDTWKSYLAAQAAAGTPVQVAYRLADPAPIQAAGGQPIPALSGENTLLTDGDGLHVTGRTDPLAAVQAMLARVAALEHNAIGG